VRQQNSGAVEDFILPYSAVYLYESKSEKMIESGPFCHSYRENKTGTFLWHTA